MYWVIDGVIVGLVMLVGWVDVHAMIQSTSLLHTGIMWCLKWRVCTRSVHFFVEVHKFLRSILLLSTLMKIIVMGILLLMKSFHANWFYDTFYRGAWAWHLVNWGALRPLSCARPHRASRLLITYESMVKFGMRFQHTLRSLIHFLDILVNVLYSFMRLSQRLVGGDNSESLCLIDILDDLTIIVKVRIVTHANTTLFVNSSVFGK